MKKIVRNGRVPTTEAICPICECEFIYDRTDVKVVSDSEYNVTCPCCKEKLAIHYENKVTLKLL